MCPACLPRQAGPGGTTEVLTLTPPALRDPSADAGPETLAVLGAARGPAAESTFRRAFALVSADVLDRVLGAWPWTTAVQADGQADHVLTCADVRG